MIWLGLLFLLAIVSGWLGFFGLSESLAGVAKWLFLGILFVILIVLFTASPMTKPRSQRGPEIGPGEDAPRQ